MLSQQNRIAKLLSDIEEAKQIAEKLRVQHQRYDPYNTIPALRNQQVIFLIFFYYFFINF